MNTAGKNKIKTDTILKNFWRDNTRFADLFNAVLFDGNSVIKPDELEEADMEISSKRIMRKLRIFTASEKLTQNWGLSSELSRNRRSLSLML